MSMLLHSPVVNGQIEADELEALPRVPLLVEAPGKDAIMRGSGQMMNGPPTSRKLTRPSFSKLQSQHRINQIDWTAS
jgi:hypothetical protein